MRRSQSTGDIDGRDSDDGAAEYIQYIDEGFIVTSFSSYSASSVAFSFYDDQSYDDIILIRAKRG